MCDVNEMHSDDSGNVFGRRVGDNLEYSRVLEGIVRHRFAHLVEKNRFVNPGCREVSSF